MTKSDTSGPESVGAVLRRERQNRGVDVDQVAKAIRVGSRSIAAIEEDRYQDLPPHPYVKGFLGSYAEFLNIDSDEVFRLYEKVLEERGRDPGRSRMRVFRYPKTERFNWRNWTIPIGLAVGAAAYLLIRVFFIPAPAVLELSSTPTPAVVTAPMPSALNEESSPPGGGLPAPGPEIPPNVRLLLKSEGATWVAAAADGGEEQRYDLRPGQNLELGAQEKLGVTLGDAGLIRITANDRELGFVGEKGRTKRGLLFVAPIATGSVPGKQPGAAGSGGRRGAAAGD